MHRALPSVVVAALVAVILSQTLAAQETKRPGHGPEMLFQRLDANKDGVIAADEVPSGAPEFIKQALIRADRNKDKKVTTEEFKEAVRRYRDRFAGRTQAEPPRHHPNPKELFARMDRNKDKQLSLEEFADGMKRIHQAMAARRSQATTAQRVAMVGRAVFQKVDRNKDGKISLDEVPEHRREGFKRILAKADKDGDEALSGEEAKRVAAYISQRIRARQGQGHPPRPPATSPDGQRPEISKKARKAKNKTEARSDKPAKPKKKAKTKKKPEKE